MPPWRSSVILFVEGGCGLAARGARQVLLLQWVFSKSYGPLSRSSNEILKWLPHDKGDLGALTALDDSELTATFFNWIDRLVHPHPRVAARSREYTSKSLSSDIAMDLQHLVEKIEEGTDLTPHLSRQVMQGFSPGRPTRKKDLSKRKDLDLLLNDWGIHHLHLFHAPHPDGSGFVARTDLVLFAIFTFDTAYLLEVMPHGTWTNQHLVEVAVHNWPGSQLFYPFPKLQGLKSPISQTDRKLLRSIGITSPIEVDGKIYASRALGIMTTGITTQAIRRADQLFDALEEIARELEKDKQYLLRRIEQITKSYPTEPQFQLVFCKGPAGFGFGIKEHVSGAIIPVGA
jgi:hypothetical protein